MGIALSGDAVGHRLAVAEGLLSAIPSGSRALRAATDFLYDRDTAELTEDEARAELTGLVAGLTEASYAGNPSTPNSPSSMARITSGGVNPAVVVAAALAPGISPPNLREAEGWQRCGTCLFFSGKGECMKFSVTPSGSTLGSGQTDDDPPTRLPTDADVVGYDGWTVDADDLCDAYDTATPPQLQRLVEAAVDADDQLAAADGEQAVRLRARRDGALAQIEEMTGRGLVVDLGRSKTKGKGLGFHLGKYVESLHPRARAGRWRDTGAGGPHAKLSPVLPLHLKTGDTFRDQTGKLYHVANAKTDTKSGKVHLKLTDATGTSTGTHSFGATDNPGFARHDPIDTHALHAKANQRSERRDPVVRSTPSARVRFNPVTKRYHVYANGKYVGVGSTDRSKVENEVTQALRARRRIAAADTSRLDAVLQEIGRADYREGVIDEAKVYRRALSSAEVRSAYVPGPRVAALLGLDEVSSRAYPGLDRSPKQNWVDKAGGLPSYIERIAKHLHYEKGKSIGHSIAIAVNTVKRWCGGATVSSTKGVTLSKGVSAKTKAQACKAVAEWNAKKASAKGRRVAESASFEDAAEDFELALGLMEAEFRPIPPSFNYCARLLGEVQALYDDWDELETEEGVLGRFEAALHPRARAGKFRDTSPTMFRPLSVEDQDKHIAKVEAQKPKTREEAFRLLTKRVHPAQAGVLTSRVRLAEELEEGVLSSLSRATPGVRRPTRVLGRSGLAIDFDPQKHPRAPKGRRGGGRFREVLGKLEKDVGGTGTLAGFSGRPNPPAYNKTWEVGISKVGRDQRVDRTYHVVAPSEFEARLQAESIERQNYGGKSYTVHVRPAPKGRANPALGARKHLLLTKADRAKLPPLYSQEKKGDDAVAYVKFFSPYSGQAWYATEFDGEDTFFGWTAGGNSYPELGYFSLSELEGASGMGGKLPLVERDKYWSPMTVGKIKAELGGRPNPPLGDGPFGPHRGPTHEGGTGPTLDSISAGDRVTIRTPQGQERTGRAVMRGPGGWVLNMGGAHGTPGIASEKNIVKVKRSGRQNPAIPDQTSPDFYRDMPLSQIASHIQSDWSQQGKGVNFAAAPYLDAMGSLESIRDPYGADSGNMVVSYFMSNSSGYHGAKAKAIKTELRRRIKSGDTLGQDDANPPVDTSYEGFVAEMGGRPARQQAAIPDEGSLSVDAAIGGALANFPGLKDWSVEGPATDAKGKHWTVHVTLENGDLHTVRVGDDGSVAYGSEETQKMAATLVPDPSAPKPAPVPPPAGTGSTLGHALAGLAQYEPTGETEKPFHMDDGQVFQGKKGIFYQKIENTKMMGKKGPLAAVVLKNLSDGSSKTAPAFALQDYYDLYDEPGSGSTGNGQGDAGPADDLFDSLKKSVAGTEPKPYGGYNAEQTAAKWPALPGSSLPISFAGEHVVVTGKIEGETRESVMAKLAAHGAIPDKSVTNKTTYLIMGDNVGKTKVNAAVAKGVQAVKWHEVKHLVEASIGRDLVRLIEARAALAEATGTEILRLRAREATLVRRIGSQAQKNLTKAG